MSLRFKHNKLAVKILLVFIALSLLPTLFFGFRLINIAGGHMERDVNVWSKLQPEYVEQARLFHSAMKTRLRNEVASFAFYSSFIAIFIALIASGVILKPLRNLTEGAKHLGSGNLDYRLPVSGSDEISQLSSAFNAMADSLRARNQELLYKELYIEKMLDPMWVLEGDNRVFDINPAFTKHFGFERDEVIGKPAQDFFDDHNRPIFKAQMKGQGERGLADVYEIAVRRKQGGNIPVLVSCSPVLESGAIMGTVSVFKDIANRKELEEDIIRKNSELYALNTIAAITSHSMDLEEILKNTVREVLTIIGMDAGGIYLPDDTKQSITCACHLNVPEQFLQRLYSFQIGEDIPGAVFLSGRTVAITDLSSDPRSRDRAICETGMKGYLCLPLKSKDEVMGILCMLSAREHHFTSEELNFLESVSHILGVAIENIKLYERERSRLSSLVSLEKSRAEAILSSIAEGVYTTDRERRITYWNKAAEAITGHRVEQVVGKPCVDVLKHENEYGERLCGKHCVMKDRASKQVEGATAFCARADGERLPIAVTSAPIKDASGAEFGRVNVFRDITREKEIDRMKTDFVRTVSHELRTPLSAIVGMTEMLLDGEIRDPQAVRDYLGTIHTEGQRLTSMVQELLDIAKIESGRQELIKDTVFVRPIIESCIHILSSYASSKHIAVNWDGPPALPPIHADKEKIHQVLFNLLNNALCYSDNGATVNIHSRVMADYLSIMFDDTGWGIPEQDLPHIFKKFYRSSQHAQRVKGTGLGLPLVSEIIKAHGGRIEVESKPGMGSAFTVLLPLATAV